MLLATVESAAALESIAGGLGVYYLLLAAMNAVCALYLWRRKDEPGQALIWTTVAIVFVIMAPLAMSGYPEWVPQMPEWFKNFSMILSGKTGAIVYSVGTTVALVTMFVFRRFFVRPMVAWTMLNIALLAMGLSAVDPNFQKIVTKPDNVPIVALVFLLGFFTWLATAKAVKNDDRIRQGLPPLEKLDDEKVLVWPDLVYTELICMIAVTALLLVWGIMLKAPLEYAASSVLTPNPSKAPWYFLGLQEMLVYFDPWYAGVVLPSLVIFGLMAIPFLDYNKLGNGYYTINQRKFSYLVFQFGFLELWITLIILGTFLRGPNWNFFGPFENWDPHKVEVLNNRDLSQLFWIDLLGQPLPRAPSGSTWYAELGTIFLREAPGILLLGAYFIILPPLLATTVFRKAFVKMGFLRYMLMSNLFLFMLTLPLKMVLRWTINLKYIVHIDEWFLNF
jgi:Cytochrome b(C-terminal)/b6/petD